jgi:hypothetical protein
MQQASCENSGPAAIGLWSYSNWGLMASTGCLGCDQPRSASCFAFY